MVYNFIVDGVDNIHNSTGPAHFSSSSPVYRVSCHCVWTSHCCVPGWYPYDTNLHDPSCITTAASPLPQMSRKIVVTATFHFPLGHRSPLKSLLLHQSHNKLQFPIVFIHSFISVYPQLDLYYIWYYIGKKTKHVRIRTVFVIGPQDTT